MPILDEVQSPARVSLDGRFIVSGAPDRKIEVFNREFANLYAIDSVAAWTLPVDTLGNAMLRVSPIGSDAILEYDLETGRFLRRR